MYIRGVAPFGSLNAAKRHRIIGGRHLKHDTEDEKATDMVWRRDGLGMRRRWPKICGLCGVILLVALAPLSAMDVEGSVELGIEKLHGHTSYEIGGLTVVSGQDNRVESFPYSKLEFPLTGWLVKAGAGLTVADVLKVNLGVKKSIIQDSGTVEDWDWGYWYLTGRPWARRSSLDIYSNSSGKVDARMGDVSVHWCLDLKDKIRTGELNEAQLRLGGRCVIQVFDYDAVNNLDQWYPSYPEYATEIENDPDVTPALKQKVKGHVYNSGDVLTYRVEYRLPFMEGGVSLGVGDRFRLEASLGYSFLARAEDADHHLLRGKVSHGSCDGTAVLFTLNSSYVLSENISIGLDYCRIAIAATGTQHQSAPHFSAMVDQHIESDQQYFGSTIGYRF
jgi:hypothetical protein